MLENDSICRPFFSLGFLFLLRDSIYLGLNKCCGIQDGKTGFWDEGVRHSASWFLFKSCLICFSPCLPPVLDALSWSFLDFIFADTVSLDSFMSGESNLEGSNCSLYWFPASFPVLSSVPHLCLLCGLMIARFWKPSLFALDYYSSGRQFGSRLFCSAKSLTTLSFTCHLPKTRSHLYPCSFSSFVDPGGLFVCFLYFFTLILVGFQREPANAYVQS